MILFKHFSLQPHQTKVRCRPSSVRSPTIWEVYKYDDLGNLSSSHRCSGLAAQDSSVFITVTNTRSDVSTTMAESFSQYSRDTSNTDSKHSTGSLCNKSDLQHTDPEDDWRRFSARLSPGATPFDGSDLAEPPSSTTSDAFPRGLPQVLRLESNGSDEDDEDEDGHSLPSDEDEAIRTSDEAASAPGIEGPRITCSSDPDINFGLDDSDTDSDSESESRVNRISGQSRPAAPSQHRTVQRVTEEPGVPRHPPPNSDMYYINNRDSLHPRGAIQDQIDLRNEADRIASDIEGRMGDVYHIGDPALYERFRRYAARRERRARGETGGQIIMITRDEMIAAQSLLRRTESGEFYVEQPDSLDYRLW